MLSALLGLAVLLGWALDLPVLRSAIPGAVEMKANTALGLIGSAAALLLLTRARGSPGRLVAALSAAVALLGLATLAEYAFGVNLGIDEWLFRDTGAAFNQAKGRMSPYSAAAFVLLGSATFQLARERVASSFARAAGGLAAAIGIVSSVGYLWNASEIVTDQIAPPVALHTSLAFIALGAAIFLLARPPAGRAGSRLETLVLGGFVPTALFVIVGGGLTYESGSNFAESSRRIAHTHGVRAEIGQLDADMANAELAQRNLMLVGDAAFDRAFAESAEGARRHAAEIGRLVADNLDQTKLHRELARLVDQRLATLEALGRAYHERGEGAAREAHGSDARRGITAQIRALGMQMDDAEAELLRQRVESAERQRRVTLITLLLTLAILTGLFLLLYRSIQREITARDAARDALQRLNAGLEQRVAERTEAVSYQQAFLRRVIDLQRDLVYAKDRNGRFVLANQALADALGTSVEALVDRRELDVMPSAEEVEGFQVDDRAVIDGGHEILIPEETLTHANGEVRWLSTVKRPIVSADGTTIVLGVSTDITAHRSAEAAVRQLAADLERRVDERTAALHESNRQLEQARLASEEASRAKSAFLANMSHEIRTPMNAIIGLTHLMATEAVDVRQRERLGKVGEAARHLLQVINDILDMSKIEAGKLTLRESEFAPDELLAGAASMVIERAREKRLELVIDADHLPARLIGDAMRLSQILINLLSNAVKFTEHGWVRLRTETLAEDAARVLIRFEVQDTGPGISAERQSALFMAFEQADNSLSRQHGGTGLGLALSRQLAIAMGGDAGVTSAPGAGSTFWFSAWLERCVEPAATLPSSELRGLRALLVDDLSESRVVVASVLSTLGLSVDSVESGADAVERAAAERAAGHRYDLAVIDWRMEPLDGIDTLTRLRETLGAELPPSILVTAYDDADIADRAAAAHFDAVLMKPLTGSALLETLGRVLGSRSRRRPAPRPADAEAMLRERHAGQRVLLAEDNEVNLEVAQELLGAVGLEVDTARHGAAAVEMALAQHYDLILMDMQMPIMDGLEATRAIRERSPQRRLPIVAMTANAFVEDRDACLAAGMDDHVTKPVDPEVMYATMLRWLPARDTERRAPAPAEPSTATEAAAPAPARPEQIALVDRLGAIEGLDLTQTLRSVAGQVPILAKILAKFVQAYRHGVPDLLDATGSEAEVLLRWDRSCHSMRGALTAIGAVMLVDELAILERSLADAANPGGLVSLADLRDMGRHVHDDLTALVAAIDACLAA